MSSEHEIFFLTDQVEKGNLRITYCPTNDMTADYMSGQNVLQVPSGKHGTVSEEKRRFEKRFLHFYIWATDKTED